MKHKKLKAASARRIQRQYRRHLQEVKARVMDTLNKVIKAQSGVRMHLAKQKRKKLQFYASVLVLQRIMKKFGHKYRMRKRRRERHIIITQAVARSYLAKKRVLDIKFLKATIIVQCALRKRLALLRKRKLMFLRDIVVVQSIIRRYLACKAVRPLKVERRRARSSIMIQCFFRCWKAWKILDHLRFLKATVHIQSCLRRFKARTHVKLLRQRKGVKTLQRYWRGFLGRKTTEKLKSAIRIQKVWRGYMGRKDFAPKLLIYKATIVLQCSFRCYRARRKLRHKKRKRLRQEFQSVHNKRVNEGIYNRLKRNAGNIKKAISTDDPPRSSPVSPTSSVVHTAKAGPGNSSISNVFDPSQVTRYHIQ